MNSAAFSASVPGKVFLMGEYAALLGHPALLATLEPRFELSYSHNNPGLQPAPHPDSPWGRLLSWKKSNDLTWQQPALEFFDPHQGQGGFGASTAQFILGAAFYLKLKKTQKSCFELWDLYRQLMASSAQIPPSGVDLIAQYLGGVSYVHPKQRLAKNIGDAFWWQSLLIFAATIQEGRKTATHQHLAQENLKKILFHSQAGLLDALAFCLERAYIAVGKRDSEGFGQLIGQYADQLAQVGLECSQTAEDRRAFSVFPSVLGVKGCGANQSDAIILWLKNDTSPTEKLKIISFGESRGLKFMPQNLGFTQKGLQI